MTKLIIDVEEKHLKAVSKKKTLGYTNKIAMGKIYNVIVSKIRK